MSATQRCSRTYHQSEARSKPTPNSTPASRIPSLIYILGLWPSLEAHHSFLASPARDQVLGPQEDQLEFRWTVHMELDAMASLPLNAPVVAIEIMAVRGDDVDAYNQASAEDREVIAQGTRPYSVAHGWRCDAVAGQHEALLFTGWETAQAHAAFEPREAAEYPAIRGKYEAKRAHHVWNLEVRRSN